MANKKAKLSLEGTKKIDGKENYVLSYSPKGGSDVDINLYFDKETFRHTRTEYKQLELERTQINRHASVNPV